MRTSCVTFQRLLVPQLVVRSKCVSGEVVFSFLIYLFGSPWCNASAAPSRSTFIWFCGDESEENVSRADFVACVFSFLYLFILYFLQRRDFDQVSATVPAWSMAISWGVRGPCWGHMRRLLACRLKHCLILPRCFSRCAAMPGLIRHYSGFIHWRRDLFQTAVTCCLLQALRYHTISYKLSSLKHFKGFADFLGGGQEGEVLHAAAAATTTTASAAIPKLSVV